MTASQNPGDLQFDKVAGAAPGGAMMCANCGKPIEGTYYYVGGKPICASCKATLESQVMAHFAKGRSTTGLVRAVLFGLGAAIAGAILYYAVIALTGLEIGLVAIVIGYMVGYSVRKGSFGVGGRRFQVLAVVLTYFAVGLAYTPLAFKQFMAGGKASALTSRARSGQRPKVLLDSSGAASVIAPDSAAASGPDSSGDSLGAASSAKPAPVKAISVVKIVGFLALFVFALPVVIVFASMPGGIISAAIIAFGMMQAWRMTAGSTLAIKGPFKVGTPPPAPAG